MYIQYKTGEKWNTQQSVKPYSFGEAYTVQQAEQLVNDIPFVNIQTAADNLSMAIWLEK